MARRFIGLDVGTESVKVTHLESSGRKTGPVMTAFAEKRLADFSVEEPDAESGVTVLELKQKKALEALLKEGFFEEGLVVTGIAGADAQLRSLEVPFTSTKKIQAVLGGLLDAQLPFDVEELVTSWSLLKKDSQKPKDASNRILLAFAKKDSVKSYLETLKSSGADPKYLAHKAAALIDILQHLIQKRSVGSKKNFAVVELGSNSTNLCVGSIDKLLLARSILRGEQNVDSFLASKLKLEVSEAKKRKIEQGLIETGTEKAKLLEQHLLSESLKEAYQPLVRELRQTGLALESQGESEISQIFLVGEGAALKNLDHYLTEMLGIQVTIEKNLGMAKSPGFRIVAPPGVDADNSKYALSVSYALFGHNFRQGQEHLDLRKGEFVWRGELSLFRKRLVPLTVWTLVILSLLLFFGLTKNSYLAKEMDLIAMKEKEACDKVLSKKNVSGAKCLSTMKNEISGSGQLNIPDFSAADTYHMLAKTIKSDVKMKTSEIEITAKKIRIMGETSSYDSVDTIAKALEKVPCVVEVDKGRSTQNDKFVRFQMNADLECDPEPSRRKASKSRKRKKV